MMEREQKRREEIERKWKEDLDDERWIKADIEKEQQWIWEEQERERRKREEFLEANKRLAEEK